MYRAVDLANYIVDKCIKDNAPVTNLQLQRILGYPQFEVEKEEKEILCFEITKRIPRVFECKYCIIYI